MDGTFFWTSILKWPMDLGWEQTFVLPFPGGSNSGQLSQVKKWQMLPQQQRGTKAIGLPNNREPQCLCGAQ